MTARSRDAGDLRRASVRLRTDFEPSGWVLMEYPAPATDHFLLCR
jgi:hypothetical protein